MDRVTVQLRRGDLVTVAGPGRYSGKPRPALIVQADLYNETHGSVTVCLVTSTLIDAGLFRIAVAPTEGNGLRAPSQIMIDKTAALARNDIGHVIGRLDATTLAAVNHALRTWLDL